MNVLLHIKIYKYKLCDQVPREEETGQEDELGGGGGGGGGHHHQGHSLRHVSF
jgi:hypothetical protein